jgi:hypothetical protein
MLYGIFGLKKEQVIVGWRKVHQRKLILAVFCYTAILNKGECDECKLTCRRQMRYTCNTFIRKSQGKTLLEVPMCTL